MSSTGPFLYPNVSSVPQQGGIQPSERGKKPEGTRGEFDQVFDQAMGTQAAGAMAGGDALSQNRVPLKFSSHASQRLADRKIQLDSAMMAKVNEAVDKAAAKGVEDTLVLTNNAALIVNVPNRTVITAMDRNQLTGNVFTNIDGAVIV